MIPAGLRRLGTASVVALLIWLGGWIGAVAPAGAGALLVALLWLPLLPAVPFIYRGRRNACVWASLVGVIYAGLALSELIANPAQRFWAAGALGLAIVMTVLLVRCARRWQPDGH